MPKEDLPQKSEEINRTESTSRNAIPQQSRTKLDYVELAKERNARVILHNAPDTYPLTDLARYADQGIRRLRNRLMITIPPEEALPLLNDYNEALVKLHGVVEKICTLTNVKYRLPRGMENMLEDQSDDPEKESIITEDATSGTDKK
jgi:hypothetical protein